MRINTTKVGIAYVVVFAISLVVVGRIIDLQFIHKPVRTVKTTRTDVLEYARGSLLACDGRYLAFSIPEYKLTMDPCQATDSLFYNQVDSLSRALADFYKDKKASEYKKTLIRYREAGRRFLYVNKRLLTHQEMKFVSQFPILREGRLGGGRGFEKVEHRTYPYGRLGFRTLGYLKSQEDIPTIGLEGSCDTLLRGTPGSQPMKLTEGRKWIVDYDRETIPPFDGYDVQTTIDIDMQDAAQKALAKILGKTTELHAGTVVLMEVATGEIKAMVNLEKTAKNGFDETYNYAIGRRGEPGSVFKAATLTLLLEDGKVGLNTEMPATVNWSYGKRIFTDHYLDHYSTISVKRGFEISSNNVFRILAANNYDKDPDAFLKRYTEQLHITQDFPFELKGFAHAHIKKTADRSWNISDLPQTAMGYSVEVTPLHTLNFYNAIANGGVMVRPHLLKNIQKGGEIIREFRTETIGRVCKETTAKTLHEAMYGVVHSVGGTGYNVFKDCKVNVAGKTGTARIVFPGTGRYEDKYGNKMHQATFIGFFPFEKPEYSMIVVVYSEPTKGNFYGATWCGPVFREIAEYVYASSPDFGHPVGKRAELPKTEDFRILDIRDAASQGLTPDVRGMGLRDALSQLEKLGYSVSFEGAGKIAGQIPAPGDSATGNIRLFLKQHNNYTNETE